MRPWRLAAVLLLAACAKVRGPEAPEAHQALEGFAVSQSYRGKPSWKLVAQTAVLQDARKQATLSEPRMEFYEKSKVTSRARSVTGLVQTETHDVTLTSDVVVESLDEGSVLKTSELLYSSKRKLFLTDKEVEIKKPEGTLRGRGMEATPDLSEIRIFNQHTVLAEKKK